MYDRYLPIRSIDIFQYPVIRWIHDIVFTVRSFETKSDMILLLCLASPVFENCERETLQDVDKNINSFLFEQIGKF